MEGFYRQEWGTKSDYRKKRVGIVSSKVTLPQEEQGSYAEDLTNDQETLD